MHTWSTRITIPAEYSETEGSYITLRQPNNAEWKIIHRIRKIAQKAEEDTDALCDALVEFCGLLSTLIIDHNLYDGEKKMTSKEISGYVNGDNALTIYILEEYFKALPLTKASNKK